MERGPRIPPVVDCYWARGKKNRKPTYSFFKKTLEAGTQASSISNNT